MDYNSIQPKLSVVLVTYNRKDYLIRSLESLLSQTLKEFEIVLVNNGSIDGTDKICAVYAERDARIKLVHIEKNQGAPQGRNRGLANASCEYITIVDDDDYCEPGMLEYLWTLKSKYDADISMCGSWNDFGGCLEPYFIYEEVLVLDKVQGLDELLKREKYNVAPPTKLFRKALFKDIPFVENVLVDDIHVIYKIFAKADKIVASGKPLYRFTKHDHNMTGFIHNNNLSASLLAEYLDMYQKRTEYLSGLVPPIQARAEYSKWSFMISMCNKIKTFNLEECQPLYIWMVEQLKADYQKFWSSSFITEQEKNLLKEHVQSDLEVFP